MKQQRRQKRNGYFKVTTFFLSCSLKFDYFGVHYLPVQMWKEDEGFFLLFFFNLEFLVVHKI